MMFSISANGLCKRFGEREVFSDISFTLSTGDSLAIVGPNGSGKTTLAMLLLGQYRPTNGEVQFSRDGHPMTKDEIRDEVALVAPYLNLYDNLSGEENLQFFAAVAGFNITGKKIESLLQRVGLENRGHDMVAVYSSGMKQRLKYAVAISSDPQFLVLDEPTTNLDENGKTIIREIIEERRKESIIILATNLDEEQELATKICRVSK